MYYDVKKFFENPNNLTYDEIIKLISHIDLVIQHKKTSLYEAKELYLVQIEKLYVAKNNFIHYLSRYCQEKTIHSNDLDFSKSNKIVIKSFRQLIKLDVNDNVLTALDIHFDAYLKSIDSSTNILHIQTIFSICVAVRKHDIYFLPHKNVLLFDLIDNYFFPPFSPANI